MLDENAQRRPKLAMLSSAVSSAMLKAMASQEGVTYVETLTGFKWLGNRATSLMQQGFSTVYAFEEALGYMFSDVVNDKDAIAAGSVFLAATSKWFTKECLTPLEKLQQLYTRYGYFKDTNTYLISPDPATTDRVFRDIRSLDSPHPTTLGQYKIIRWRDLTVGYDSATSSHLPDLPVSPDSQMITCEVEGRIKFTIRGSGTEPKIKGEMQILLGKPGLFFTR
jgi:phosphoglucomutase